MIPTFGCSKRAAPRRDPPPPSRVLGEARGALSGGDCRHLPGTGAAAGDRRPGWHRLLSSGLESGEG